MAARPAVLLDGLSPAPRAIADLLIALRKAGAQSISAPCCAECGKPLRTIQRRSQDWYCAVCGPRPEKCAACGEFGRIATRDRAGRPRCQRCPDEDQRDPIALITGQVTALDPAADPAGVAAAVRTVAFLARTLGIHTDVAVAWQRLSSGDWTAYAAEVSQRT